MDLPVIVIDNGSHSIKGGFAGDFAPQHVVESTIARHKLGQQNERMYCGTEMRRAPKGAQRVEVFQDISSVDWNGVEKLYKHLVHSNMQIETHEERYNFILSERPSSHLHKSVVNNNRMRSAQIMFETMNARGIYYGLTPTLSLYAAGKTSGLVVETGFRNTIVAPIEEGYMLDLHTRTMKYGGLNITQKLQSLLSQSQTQTQAQSEILDIGECRKIKERLCFIQSNPKADIGSDPRYHSRIEYALPDGRTLCLGSERYTVGELMFAEYIRESESESETQSEARDMESLPYVVHGTVRGCDTRLSKTLYGNVVLSGGNSMFPGMCDRLMNNLVHLAPAYVKVNIHTSPQRNYATFTGASLLGSQSQMKEVWIDEQLYDELGAQAFAVRCF